MFKPVLGLLLSGIFLFAQSGGSPPRAASRATKLVEEHAQWSEGLQSIISITPDQFKKDGLSRLTPSELSDLSLDLYIWHQKELANKITYHCGPAAASKKIRVFFDQNDSAPSDVISTLKQRVRAISDVEIVFSEEAADLSVSLLILRSESVSGAPLGFVGSTATTSPCNGMMGSSKWPMSVMSRHAIYSAGSPSAIAEQIVAGLDAHDFETERKSKSYQ
jgi:hypothetical protein